MSSILYDIQYGVASSLNVTTEVAGLILTACVLFGVGITVNLINSKKNTQMVTTVVMLSTMGVLTAIAWCPVWVMVVTLIVVAAMFGSTVKGWIG